MCFFAEFEGKKVVLKKLAHTSELKELGHFSGDFNEIKNKLVSDSSEHFKICNIDTAELFLQKLIPRDPQNIQTILYVNAEPILLEMFTSTANWHVPKFYGFCGRLSVMENCGSPLNSLDNCKWFDRAYVALQLLQAANNFTENHKDFRLYLTDISPDNIAVNENFKISFIDLEDAILIKKASNGKIHYTEHFYDESYSYSEKAICDSSISDHNLYAVCRAMFKKQSPNGKLTMYIGKRDFIDHISGVEPIDGVVVIDNDYKDRKIFGQVICSFRYGREEDEVMGLNFQKDLYLASEQVFPPPEKAIYYTKLQERLMKKLGENCYPFTFTLPPNTPASVTLQPGQEDEGQPCGVHYYVKLFVGENDTDRSHKRSAVMMAIRKIQYAPSKQGRQPCTVVRKDFMMSPGELELEVTLDKQLYHHGEKISVNICVRNNSNKVVKKIKAMVQQGVDVVLFQNGQYRTTVASLETQMPYSARFNVAKSDVSFCRFLSSNKDRRGIALDGQLKKQDTNLASTTLLASPDQRDAFGIIVSYAVKVKLYLGALGGELSAELPFVLMHPKPSVKNKGYTCRQSSRC
ncbi:hypothetical protein NQ317_006295 [Molorchus minor]|uniref:Arrestin C-terminal-like domain-containing protein n=1 Tax=Molorchus minor TaxID=1323400 RepID=A0ABQ9JEE8_9CUCU|nr:hypothetical protein NQ317_006295 [Molorchus minor]